MSAPQQSVLDVKTATVNGRDVVQVRGEVDMRTAPGLRDRLLEAAQALSGQLLISIAAGIRAAYEAGAEGMRLLEACGGTVEGEAIVHVGHAEGLRARGDLEGARAAIAGNALRVTP